MSQALSSMLRESLWQRCKSSAATAVQMALPNRNELPITEMGAGSEPLPEACCADKELSC